MLPNVRRPAFGLLVGFFAIKALVLAFVAVGGEVPTKLRTIVGANIVAAGVFADEPFAFDAKLLWVLTFTVFEH